MLFPATCLLFLLWNLNFKSLNELYVIKVSNELHLILSSQLQLFGHQGQLTSSLLPQANALFLENMENSLN